MDILDYLRMCSEMKPKKLNEPIKREISQQPPFPYTIQNRSEISVFIRASGDTNKLMEKTNGELGGNLK